MKIRSHFILILVILTAVPILFLSGFYIYLYATAPERFLFDNLAKMKSFDVKSLTKKDRAAITKYLRERSPNLEEAFFFSDGIVIHSTIPSIPDKGRIDSIWRIHNLGKFLRVKARRGKSPPQRKGI